MGESEKLKDKRSIVFQENPLFESGQHEVVNPLFEGNSLGLEKTTATERHKEGELKEEIQEKIQQVRMKEQKVVEPGPPVKEKVKERKPSKKQQKKLAKEKEKEDRRLAEEKKNHDRMAKEEELTALDQRMWPKLLAEAERSGVDIGNVADAQADMAARMYGDAINKLNRRSPAYQAITARSDRFYKDNPTCRRRDKYTRDIVAFAGGVQVEDAGLLGIYGSIEKLLNEETKQEGATELIPAYNAAYTRLRTAVEAITDGSQPGDHEGLCLMYQKLLPLYKAAQITKDIGKLMEEAGVVTHEQNVYVLGVCSLITALPSALNVYKIRMTQQPRQPGESKEQYQTRMTQHERNLAIDEDAIKRVEESKAQQKYSLAYHMDTIDRQIRMPQELAVIHGRLQAFTDQLPQDSYAKVQMARFLEEKEYGHAINAAYKHAVLPQQINARSDEFFSLHPQYGRSSMTRDIVAFCGGVQVTNQQLDTVYQQIKKLEEPATREEAASQLMPTYQVAFSRIQTRLDAIIGNDAPPACREEMVARYNELIAIYKEAQITRDVGNAMKGMISLEQGAYMSAVCQYIIGMSYGADSMGLTDEKDKTALAKEVEKGKYQFRTYYEEALAFRRSQEEGGRQ